jgi:tRNA wybutosine-synthesizing protein 1
VRVFVGAAEALDDDDEHDVSGSDGEGGGGSDGEGVVDLEDLGVAISKSKVAAKERSTTAAPRAMITPQLRSALTKQGYKLVGTHSGVKLCRWTKSMLRGRGGCYKHTFYGIESHRCMETTPSLACANKCVFCWRHHTNPVGTEWRWQMDEPEVIIDGVMERHYDMIKTFRGVPGVLPERLAEANHIKHCALSLVGEPIMYPKVPPYPHPHPSRTRMRVCTPGPSSLILPCH